MITWSSHEFHYHDKNESWPVYMVLGAFAVALYALWQENFLFLIFIAIAIGLVLFWGRKEPRELEFMLDKKGIHIGGRLYRYPGFVSFSLHDETLQLHPKSTMRREIIIHVPEEKADAIREHLLAFMPEVEYTESFVEVIGHWLKF